MKNLDGIETKRVAQDIFKAAPDALDKIINSIADPMFVKDDQHKWILLNDACCVFIGATRENLVGKSDHDFFPKEQADIFWKYDEIVLKTGKENLNEELLTDANGKTSTILTRKNLYEDKSGNKWIVGIFNDITEKRAYEQRLEEKNIALKELLSQIEHEKQQIKERILANMDYLISPILRKLKKEIKPSGQRYFELLEQNFEDLTTSFGHSISRRQQGLTPMEIEICNLIKNGMRTKEIATFLKISPLTVETHRNRIRKKLGINNQHINLVTFLQHL